MSPALVAATIESIPGVKNVHDLHIWAGGTTPHHDDDHVQVDGGDQALTTDLQTIRNRVTNHPRSNTRPSNSNGMLPSRSRPRRPPNYTTNIRNAEFCTAITGLARILITRRMFGGHHPLVRSPHVLRNLSHFPNARARLMRGIQTIQRIDRIVSDRARENRAFVSSRLLEELRMLEPFTG